MKKMIIVLLLALVAVTAVFAGQKASLSVLPYSFQSVREVGTENYVNSTYGLGGKAKYINFKDGSPFYIAFEAGSVSFWAEEKSNFTTVYALAKAGYSYELKDYVSLYAEAGCGADLQIYDKNGSFTSIYAAELGAEFAATDKLCIAVSCEGLFAFAEKDNANYNNWTICPSVGVVYSF